MGCMYVSGWGFCSKPNWFKFRDFIIAFPMNLTFLLPREGSGFSEFDVADSKELIRVKC